MFDLNESELEKTFVEGNLEGKALPFSTDSPSNEKTAETTEVPEYLGSGSVREIIGTGGMARVYKIWNEKLEVFRAVKILKTDCNNDLKTRFETEAKITAKLHHPNIVDIYNIGEWKDLPYIEMEYIDGITLQEFIHNHGRLPDVVCSSIAICIARALVYAHSLEILIYGNTYQGVIHRDLKPSNILISRTGEVKLTDFGIARPAEASLHTLEGNIVGTLHYLSPEQMEGEDVDCRTDIYSFGTILYEMLTGVKTFPQERISSLMKSRVLNKFKKPTDFEFPVSTNLSKIALHCLENQPQKRYTNAQMLLPDLETAHFKLTSKQPQSVIGEYIKNPDSVSSARKKTGFSLSRPVKIGAILSATALIILSILHQTTTKSQNTDLSSKDTKPIPAENHLQTVSLPDVPEENRPAHDPISTAAQPRTDSSESAPKPGDIQPQKPAVKRTADITQKKAAKPKPLPPIPSTVKKAVSITDPDPDPMAAGMKAAQKGDWGKAAHLFELAEKSHQGGNKRFLLLFEAYLRVGELKKAEALAESYTLQDAQYDLLTGKLHQKKGNFSAALKTFERSLTKPSSYRNRMDICNDALYFIAEIRNKTLESTPSEANRTQAVDAWNRVVRAYSSRQGHARLLRAEKRLSELK